MFLYTRHSGSITRDQKLRLTENIPVIEKLRAALQERKIFCRKKEMLGRLPYRYYRLARPGGGPIIMNVEMRACAKQCTPTLFLTYRLNQWRSWLSSRRMNLS